MPRLLSSFSDNDDISNVNFADNADNSHLAHGNIDPKLSVPNKDLANEVTILY